MRYIFITFILFGGCIFIRPKAVAQPASISPRAKAVIDSTYNALIKQRKVEGLSLAIVDHGKVVYACGYGFADVKNQKKADSLTLYRIGSCTKSFTALALMQLEEKQKLKITDPVTNYLTDLKIKSRFNDHNDLAIRDLMSHVSGLPCDVTNGFFCDSPPDMKWLIQELNKQYTIFPKRYIHAYSNVAYGLLGETIGRVSGMDYSDYIRTNIFQPLGMHHSFITYDSVLARGYAKGYYNGKEAIDPMIRDQAAGLVHSNVMDMANYLMMYMNKGTFNNRQLVGASSIQQMESNQIASIDLYNGDQWGYGLYTSNLKVKRGKDSSEARLTGHGGDTYLYHTDFKYIPELQVGAILLTNSSNGGGMVNANRLLKIYLKQKDSTSIEVVPDRRDTNQVNAQKDISCTDEEIKGAYNLGDIILNVTNTNKMTFYQGPAKVTFNRKPDHSDYYTAKAVVYHVIPVKIKNQEFHFVKHNEQVYLKVRFTSDSSEEYMGMKCMGTLVSVKWKSRRGEYVAANKIYTCKDCPFMNFEGAILNFKERDGFIQMTFKGKTPDTYTEMYLDVLSDDLAVVGGIGRGKGETVKMLENGNIYYSGMEFRKK